MDNGVYWDLSRQWARGLQTMDRGTQAGNYTGHHRDLQAPDGTGEHREETIQAMDRGTRNLGVPVDVFYFVRRSAYVDSYDWWLNLWVNSFY